MAQPYAIGIDIGGTNTKFGIVNQSGEILQQNRLQTNKYEKVQDFINELHEKLQPMINEAGGIENFSGIGIGAPNGNYYTGNIEYAANLRWKGIVPFAKMVSDKFGLLTRLTNDANAAAVGEMMYGAAKGMKDFIMITLGTGVGSGIVANGRLIYGHDGFAGELGHTTIIPNGRLHPNTGMKGSLESYASATGVANTAREVLTQRKKEDSPNSNREFGLSSCFRGAA